METGKRLLVSALSLCGIGLTVDRTAAADLAQSANITTLPEITVTAQRSAESTTLSSEPSTLRLTAPILDTPVSIKEVTRELLDKQLVLDPQEAVRNVSGVVRAASFTGLGENYILRGFVQQDVIKDGFRVGEISNGGINATGPTDMANIDRIDVLKGPTAILYGRGEPGGLVNYITRMPAFANTLDLRQQFGSYGFYRTEIHGNWNAVPKQFAVRLDAAYDQSESFTDFVESQRGFVAPAFRWQVTPDTSISLRTEFTHDERETNPGCPVVNGRVL
jgi:iron complex outermembrane receptor protein